MSKNEKLNAWVQEIEELCKPDAVHWCDGSDAENANLIQRMLDAGTARKLNESKRPNSYLVWSDHALKLCSSGPSPASLLNCCTQYVLPLPVLPPVIPAYRQSALRMFLR